MQCLLAVYFFLLLSVQHRGVLVETVDFQGIQDDLAEYNKTCSYESCYTNAIDSLSIRNCHCGIQCVQFGTCCLDSSYVSVRQPQLKPTCRATHKGKHDYYFMVDWCPSTNSVWASQCSKEWDGEDDLQQIVPVTSLLTSITYKNYYCLRCHETTDEFIYWNIWLESQYADNSGFNQRDDHISLTYDKINERWMACSDKSKNWETLTYFPVQLSITVPLEIYNLAHDCYPDIISDCSEKWEDEKVREKCQSYMALKEVFNSEGIFTYKNIHCALCNFENLNTVNCKSIISTAYGKVPFSFTYLLDINRSDGELVGKIQKCSDDHIWDPYTEKCRKLSCALPGYSVKNGKCTRG